MAITPSARMRFFPNQAILLLAFHLLPAADATTFTLTLNAVRDNHLSGRFVGLNNGAGGSLQVGNGWDGLYRSLLSFDLAPYRGFKLVAATLVMSIDKFDNVTIPCSSESAIGCMKVHQVLTEWTEGDKVHSQASDNGSTWLSNDYPNLWAAPGGDFDINDPIGERTFEQPGDVAAFFDLSVPRLQALLNDLDNTYHGFLLQHDDNPGNTDFESRECEGLLGGRGGCRHGVPPKLRLQFELREQVCGTFRQTLNLAPLRTLAEEKAFGDRFETRVASLTETYSGKRLVTTTASILTLDQAAEDNNGDDDFLDTGLVYSLCYEQVDSLLEDDNALSASGLPQDFVSYMQITANLISFENELIADGVDIEARSLSTPMLLDRASDSENGVSTVVIVGAVVGGGLILLGVFIALFRRRNDKTPQEKSSPPQQQQVHPAPSRSLRMNGGNTSRPPQQAAPASTVLAEARVLETGETWSRNNAAHGDACTTTSYSPVFKDQGRTVTMEQSVRMAVHPREQQEVSNLSSSASTTQPTARSDGRYSV